MRVQLIIFQFFQNMQVGTFQRPCFAIVRMEQTVKVYIMAFLMFNFNTDGYGPYFERLRLLFEAMDRQYSRAAAHYGFTCSGCPDNCCRTRFYHHTHIEFLFLQIGYRSLNAEIRRMLKTRAAGVCQAPDREKMDSLGFRSMCPLNVDALCSLYAYRPMICRLHGIPHELNKPDGNTVCGPGCITFDKLCAHQPYRRFDRTGFYLEMAQLEQDFKAAASLDGKIKMTIAEMIARFPL